MRYLQAYFAKVVAVGVVGGPKISPKTKLGDPKERLISTLRKKRKLAF